MVKQVKHIRRSKLGKRFVAGSKPISFNKNVSITVNRGLNYFSVDKGNENLYYARGEAADEMIELYDKHGKKAVLEFLEGSGIFLAD